MQLILASTSPRRRELLALLGLPFQICAPDFEEQPVSGLTPIHQVRRFAQEKARSIARQQPEHLVLGSDTVIELDGQMLGKPMDLNEARGMLTKLAGRDHLVHTAVALCCVTRHLDLVEVSTATVHMKPDQADGIERYLATGESLGKAGAYSIQGDGGALVENVRGDYLGVVGLPLRLLVALLAGAGIQVPVDIDALYREKPYPNWTRFAHD
ncbi:Maf family protein [Nitrospira sp. NS4]|uniref:Maf family protein n=1 Tax=Nitrospira sp. NS4 TaxID=3414498 RepID=UPI003C2EBE26